VNTRTGAALLLATYLVACSTLPEHARPQAGIIDPADYRATDVTRYRELSRADFRASAPPPAVAAHATAFGAFTCANVVPDGPTRVHFDPGAQPNRWIARLEDTTFHSEMDRGCSWWNPTGIPVPSEYVLEHEQIHFALTEIHARRLSATLLEIRLPTDSQPDAAAQLQRRYDAMLRATMDELVRESTAFDEDTSGRHEPLRQSRWLARVESELAKTEALPGVP
jgi:hypothetical protein